jgi:NADH-quinone oxidoreductase subunit E
MSDTALNPTDQTTAPATEEPPVDMEFVDQVIDRYGAQPHFALQMLLDINNEFNYLPQAALRHMAQRVKMAPSNLYSIATFFKAFSLKPRGRHIISLCLGTACHVNGAPKLFNRIKSELGIDDGETTEDMRFSLGTVRCLGACALAPVMVIDGETHSRLAPDQLPDILNDYE